MLWPDVIDLKSFYSSAMGQVACQILRRSLKQLWDQAEGETLVGIGYTSPFLRPWLDKCDLTISCMPAAQGVVHWPQGRTNLTILTDETALPLPTGTVNRLLLVHALENTEHSRALLAEAHRLLTPSGRLMVIVPNRRGIWARSPASPFAHGQPYSGGQLKSLMRENQFTPLNTDYALFLPPTQRRYLLRFARVIEAIGHSFFTAFGGVIILEAEKRIFAPTRGTLQPVKTTVRGYRPARATPFKSR